MRKASDAFHTPVAEDYLEWFNAETASQQVKHTICTYMQQALHML